MFTFGDVLSSPGFIRQQGYLRKAGKHRGKYVSYAPRPSTVERVTDDVIGLLIAWLDEHDNEGVVLRHDGEEVCFYSADDLRRWRELGAFKSSNGYPMYLSKHFYIRKGHPALSVEWRKHVTLSQFNLVPLEKRDIQELVAATLTAIL